MCKMLFGKNSTNNKKSYKTTDLRELKPEDDIKFTFKVQRLELFGFLLGAQISDTAKINKN